MQKLSVTTKVATVTIPDTNYLTRVSLGAPVIIGCDQSTSFPPANFTYFILSQYGIALHETYIYKE